ncbi:Uncharacterised protein [Klebsiella pneumoniae]|mgnify:CR=1 FL=1|nr:Uncharacterised protein [Klebsiella pneumoniae]SXP99358.1 Uncharacterised protein [Klebsiella pneumoniae]VAS39414.1 Uncharacterised protein [Klebsiella pneumoniae]VGG85186.1 Uncharacterised protein [Klebsiella pneumoniae]VUI16028.1 Uncharacterised protein [Klebsiella pneumoniae]
MVIPLLLLLSVYLKKEISYFPVILLNHYRIVFITSSLGIYDNSWHVKSLLYESTS